MCVACGAVMGMIKREILVKGYSVVIFWCVVKWQAWSVWKYDSVLEKMRFLVVNFWHRNKPMLKVYWRAWFDTFWTDCVLQAAFRVYGRRYECVMSFHCCGNHTNRCYPRAVISHHRSQLSRELGDHTHAHSTHTVETGDPLDAQWTRQTGAQSCSHSCQSKGSTGVTFPALTGAAPEEGRWRLIALTNSKGIACNPKH